MTNLLTTTFKGGVTRQQVRMLGNQNLKSRPTETTLFVDNFPSAIWMEMKPQWFRQKKSKFQSCCYENRGLEDTKNRRNEGALYFYYSKFRQVCCYCLDFILCVRP